MCNVLFIGNDSIVAEMTSKIIEKHGYNVSYITKCTDSVTIEPDLILFDCDMSPVPGFKRYKELLNQYRSAKVIWISPSGDDEVSALEAGADDWIRKPLKIDVLIARLNKLQKYINDK